MSLINKFREVLHPAFSVRVLEEHPTHIVSTEVHLMGKLQHGLHPDVATNYKRHKLLQTTVQFSYMVYLNSKVQSR